MHLVEMIAMEKQEKGLQVFDFRDRPVRVVKGKDGEPWFVARDVCDVLEIGNVGDVLSSLDEDEKGSIDIVDGTPGSPRKGVVNEPGLYSLILRSRKPEARQFKRWVTHEVLPSIRKRGTFALDQVSRGHLALLILDAEADLKEASQKISLLEPKAEVFDLFISGENAQPMEHVAKALGTGRNRLFRFLREKRVLLPNGLPYQRYLDRGYFRVVETPYMRGDVPANRPKTLVTAKGFDYLQSLMRLSSSLPARAQSF